MTDMLRIELLHPLITHFPIALLFNAGLVRLLILIFHKRQWVGHLRSIYFWSLIVGTAGLFAAYFSGEQAEHVVESLICDPEVIEDHEDFGKLTILFSSLTIAFAFVVAMMNRRREHTSKAFDATSGNRKSSIQQAFTGIELFALVGALSALSYASHLGASLVYLQGAGYHQTPDPKCKDSVESIDSRSEIIEPTRGEGNYQ
jgi:uncharacterized membrane protein